MNDCTAGVHRVPDVALLFEAGADDGPVRHGEELGGVFLVDPAAQQHRGVAGGRGKFLHPWFVKVHPKHGTPTNAVLFTLCLTLIAPWFGRSALNWIVDMSAMGTALAYLSTCLVVYKYASRFADQTRGGASPWPWSVR